MRGRASRSRASPGFDFVQQQDDPTRFVLVEAYRTAEAPAAHKETKHYQAWRDAVAPMMAEPRASVKFGEPLSGRRGLVKRGQARSPSHAI